MGTRVSELPVVTSVTGTDTMPIIQGGNTVQVAIDVAVSELDIYPSTVFTPVLSFGGYSVGLTYSSASAECVKVGKLVTLTGQIILTNKGSSTGAALISGLPYTCADRFSANSTGSLRLSAVTYTGQAVVITNTNTKTLSFRITTEAGVASAMTDANFSNTSNFIFSISYMTDE